MNIGRTAALAFADIIVRFLTKGETLALPAVISRTNAQLPLSKARREHKVKPPLEFCMMFDPHSDEALSALQAAVVQDDATEAQRLLAAGVDPNKAAGRSRPQNALQVAVRLRRGRQIELLLDFGAQPSLYCAPVTALGLAAYDFYFQGVELMAARGPDLRLLLLPEHTPDQALHRTTLLHRLMERPANSISPLPQQGLANGSDQEEKIKIVLFLAQRYHLESGEPLPLSSAGLSPLDFGIEDDAHQALRAWFATAIEGPAIRSAIEPSASVKENGDRSPHTRPGGRRL